MEARFSAMDDKHLEEFEKLAKQYGVELTDKYATPNAFWVETYFSIDTNDVDVICAFKSLEDKYYK